MSQKSSQQVNPARSRLMSRVRQKNTKPEVAVRRYAHSLGYRFRLHRKDLPGSPDLVFPSRAKVVFVHGCFWHRHPSCRYATTPKSRQAFWEEKFHANQKRDARNLESLKNDGWKALIIWECQVKDDTFKPMLKEFLQG